jgi:transposase
MAQYDQLTELLDLPNTRVTHYQLVGHHRLNLFVESTLAAALCPTCQQVSLAMHDRGEPQFIRDLSIWNRRCWLRHVPRRFECATCNTTFVERLAWREPNRDYTQRYEHAIYERVRREPTSQVAQAEQLSEDQVQGIFERWAKKH